MTLRKRFTHTILAMMFVFGTLPVLHAWSKSSKRAPRMDFKTGFEKPRSRAPSPGLIPIDFTLPFAAGDQDRQFYGLTKEGARTGTQSFFINLRNNGGGAGWGASGVVREFRVDGLEAGHRFTLEAWMANDPTDPIRSGFGNIRIEFYGPTSRDLMFGTDEGFYGEDTIDAGNAKTTFQRFEVDYTVGEDFDAEDVTLIKVIVGGNTDDNSGKGRVFVDDLTFKSEAPDPEHAAVSP